MKKKILAFAVGFVTASVVLDSDMGRISGPYGKKGGWISNGLAGLAVVPL